MTDQRPVIISCDGHATGRPADYQPYIEPAYREQYDEFVRVLEAARVAREQATQEDRSLFSKEGSEAFAAETGNARDGEWNSPLRTEVLEGEGVVAEVLFPNAGVPFGGFGESAQHELRGRGQPRVRPLAARLRQRRARTPRRARDAHGARSRRDRRRDRVGARQRDARRDHPHRAGRRPASVLRRVLRPDVGGVPGPRDARAHPRRERHTELRRLRRGEHAHLRNRDGVLRAPSVVVPDLGWRARTVPAHEARVHRVAFRLGTEHAHVSRRHLLATVLQSHPRDGEVEAE